MAERKIVTYEEPTKNEQVAYAGVAVAAATILSWAAGELSLVVPAEVTAAAAVVIGWAAGKWGT